jgi:hypothetical protein
MHLKLVPAVGAVRNKYRIIEIARGLAIDCHDWQIAEVPAAIYFKLVDDGNCTGFGENLLWKNARELMLADHHLDIDTEVIGIAEDFNDAADGRSSGRWPTGDFDINDEAFEVVIVRLGCGFAPNDPMRSCRLILGEFLPSWDDNALGHTLVKRNQCVALFPIGARVAEDAYDGGIAALEDSGDAPKTAAIGAGRRQFDQDLVALHRAIDFVGRNKDVIVFSCALACIGTDEAISVAMKIETTREQVVARCAAGLAGDGPMLAVGFDEVAASGDAGELFQKQAPLAPAAQADFADQLLVTGFASGRTRNVRQQFAIVHRSRVEQAGAGQLALRDKLHDLPRERLCRADCGEMEAGLRGDGA